MLDALFKGKALSPRGIGSVALAIGGVGLLNLGPTSQQLTTAATANFFSIGDAYCLLQALFFGIGYWRLESASVRYPDESVRLTAGQLAAIAAGSIVYWLVADGGGLLENVTQLVAFVVRDPFVWKALVWTGLFSTALAIYLETVALRVVSATELTVLMTSVSLWGSAFAYVLTGEVLPVVSMVGGLLILTGCILTATGKQSTDP